MQAARLIAAFAGLGYGFLAVFSGFDRAAANHPALAAYLPAVFAAQAPAAEARRFVEAGLAAPALKPARRALLADPANPAGSALFATALLADRQPRPAARAFQVSAQLGWREPLTQVYWLEIALASGDQRAAVLRFDALARQYPYAPAVTAAANRIETSEAGRRALAERIGRGAAWSNSYAQIDGSTGAERLNRRARVLLAATAVGTRIGCQGAARIVSSLALTDPRLGAELWRAECPQPTSQSPVDNGGFEAGDLLRPRVPFEWELAGDGAVEATLLASGPDKAGSGRVLQLRSSAPASLPVLTQLVRLDPGHYRVSWTAAPQSQSGRLQVTLACRRDGPTRELPVTAGIRAAQSFTVGAACAAHWLQFWLTPGPDAVLLDSVRIEKN